MSIFTYHKFPFSFFNGECEKVVEIYKNTNAYRSIVTNPNFFNIIDLPEDLTILGQKVVAVVLIVARPNHNAPAHTDGTPKSSQNTLALNIPISGCERSFTRFYESKDPNPLRQNLVETQHQHTDRKFEKLLSEYKRKGLIEDIPHYYVHKQQYLRKASVLELTSPSLINVNTAAHEVINYKPTKRIALSIRFFEDPWHWIPEHEEGQQRYNTC